MPMGCPAVAAWTSRFPKPKSGFEKWQDTISSAVDNADWDAYDCEFQKAAIEFNHHLAGTPDWKNSPLPERQALSCPIVWPD
jgi:hypothetical protein